MSASPKREAQMKMEEAISDRILDLIDNQSNFTRSDLQGLAVVIAMDAVRFEVTK